MRDLSDIARECATVADALVRLHKVGASPIEAIRAVRNAKRIELGEAKIALHASPAWHAEARAAEELHEQLVEELERDPDL